jgi:hypothetical protein
MVLDYDLGSCDDPMGCVTLQVSDLSEEEKFLKLAMKPDKDYPKAKGTLHVKARFFEGDQEPPPMDVEGQVTLEELKAKERMVRSLESQLAKHDKTLNETLAESRDLDKKVRKLKLERRQLRRETNQCSVLERFLWAAVRRVIDMERNYENINLDHDIQDLVRLGKFYPMMKKKAIVVGASELQHRINIKESGGLPSLSDPAALNNAAIWLCFKAIPKIVGDSNLADAKDAIDLWRIATNKRQNYRTVDIVLSEIAGKRIRISDFTETFHKLDLSRAELVSLLDAAEELRNKHNPSLHAPKAEEPADAQPPDIDIHKLLTRVHRPKVELAPEDSLIDSEDEKPCVEE